MALLIISTLRNTVFDLRRYYRTEKSSMEVKSKALQMLTFAHRVNLCHKDIQRRPITSAVALAGNRYKNLCS